MLKRRRLYEGKAKILYPGPEPGTLIQYFKDDITARNGEKNSVLDGKGVINNRISEYLFFHLHRIGLPNHFVRRLNMREQVIRELEMTALEVVVRNVATGSLSARLGLEDGKDLPRPISEFYLKNDELNDPQVNEDHILAFGWASTHDIDDMIALAMRANDFLCGLFLGVGLRLVDFKMEFGRLYENDVPRILIADEISPDTCRLWDLEKGEKMDKDRFRLDLGGVVEAYREVGRRLGVLSDDDVNEKNGATTVTALPIPLPPRRGRGRPGLDVEPPRG